jgi:hypothetical protein
MPEDVTPCHIRIDKEGNWYYQDLPIINKKIYLYLNQCIAQDPSGRYILSMDGETCCLEVEDTPFVIQEVRLLSDPGQSPSLVLKLNDGTEETLKAATLRVGQDNVLYCKVKGGLYDARLLRNAYYQLAEFLEQDGQNYYLVIEDSKIHLKNL